MHTAKNVESFKAAPAFTKWGFGREERPSPPLIKMLSAHADECQKKYNSIFTFLSIKFEIGIRQREETNKDPNEQKQTILKLKQESLMESVFHRLKDVG